MTLRESKFMPPNETVGDFPLENFELTIMNKLEQDQYIEPAVAWIKYVLAQEQRPVIVACDSINGCDAVAEQLDDVGSVSLIEGYMTQAFVDTWFRKHEHDNMPTIVVGTYLRIGSGVAFDWPSAYITASCSLRVGDQVQLMARPRKALTDKRLLAYFPHTRPSNGWLTVADYVDYTIGGHLRPMGFDGMLDKTFSYNLKRD